MLCGIDEAGRGCLAGPLVVAGVVLNGDIAGLNDSKQLSSKKREELYEKIVLNSHYEIVWSDNTLIDDVGLSVCIKRSIEQIISVLNPKKVIMDGNTNFGVKGVEAIIKADATVKEVSAASILAKVSRDRYMMSIDTEYPEYGFCNHKGYGTKAHVEAIKSYGYCSLHRKSFQLKALQKSLFDF